MATGAIRGIDLNKLTAIFDEATQRAKRELGKINVLVAGLTGVGKSTLINTIFGQQVAITGIGSAQTARTEPHEVPNSPLRIYDTRGFEISKAAETVGAVKRCIEELRASTDTNNQVHIAWTCILEQSHRIEAVHKDLLAMLNLLKVPSVVVITQALGEAEMKTQVGKLAVPNDAVVPVLAEAKVIAGHTFAPHGISELVETSLRLTPKGQQAAFIAAQKARWDLKEAEVLEIINSTAALAAATALVPIPGGHSVALIGLQVTLMARINAVLGISLSDTHGGDLARGFFGIVLAKAGGTTAFTMTLAEAMKFFPGIGWFGAAMIGGPIGATLTKTFGHLYFNSVLKYAQKGEPLPSAEELTRHMEQLFEKNRAHYETLAKETV